MKDHLVSENILKQHNDILGRCMYCSDPFGMEDKWKIDPFGFTSYISVTCSSCDREHRFKDPKIHSIEDIIDILEKNRQNKK